MSKLEKRPVVATRSTCSASESRRGMSNTCGALGVISDYVGSRPLKGFSCTER